MDNIVKFSINDIEVIEAENYPTDEFAIARLGFLGSNPNSHKLNISNEVLLKDASTVLGKFVVADINPLTKDATTHTLNETIKGYVPFEQRVVFKEEDGYLRAYVDAVISKIYASDFCEIFENGEHRDVSVEMRIETENNKDMDDVVTHFNIVGITALGKGIKPSSPNSEMQFTRFSEKEASAYFEKTKEQTSKIMKNFAEKRRAKMAEEKYVSHPIDISKDAIYEGEWDGNQAKQDLIKEKNYKTLAPKICLRLEDGWEDREVTKLGYPVMCLDNGKWVYSRKGLASALGYAKQHDDNDIVSKVEAIYKKLGLDSDRKEESAKMNEIEFAAVNIGDMWGKLYDALRNKYPYGEYDCLYWIDSIWEESNKKYALIHKRDDNELWRLDFSLTEEGLTIADEIVKVEVEIVETDEIRKFAEPEDVSKYKDIVCEDICAKCGESMSECECTDDEDENEDEKVKMEELSNKIAQLESDIAERDNIIMEKDKELEELRQYRDAKMEEDKARVVGSVLGSLEDFLDKAELEACRTEGMACQFGELDGWSNKVKASVVDRALKKGKKSTEFTRISKPEGFDNKKSNNVWDRI